VCSSDLKRLIRQEKALKTIQKLEKTQARMQAKTPQKKDFFDNFNKPAFFESSGFSNLAQPNKKKPDILDQFLK
jgi:hypothetical protein